MTVRGPIWQHIVIRLADEGVPIGAICRALRKDRDTVTTVLRGAVRRGDLVELPALDWPRHLARRERHPMIAPTDLADVDLLTDDLMAIYAVTRAEGRCLAALLRRGNMAKPSLHVAMSTGEPRTVPKIVDVIVHRLRKKLAPHGLDIATVWGSGYSISKIDRKAIMDRLDAHRTSFASEVACA